MQCSIIQPHIVASSHEGAKSPIDILPDYVLEHLLSTVLLTGAGSEGFFTLLRARLVCKKWETRITNVFLNNALIAGAIGLYFLLGHKKDAMVTIPSYLLTIPLFADMLSSTNQAVVFIDEGLHRSFSCGNVATKVAIFAHMVADKTLHCHKEHYLEYMPLSLQEREDIALKAVEGHGMDLKNTSEKVRSTKKIVAAAVKNEGWSLQFASKELQDDEEIVLIAVLNNGLALEFASQRLRATRKIVLIAIQNNGWGLQFASPKFRSDKEIVLSAVENDREALIFASLALQTDIEIAATAKKQCAFFPTPRYSNEIARPSVFIKNLKLCVIL